MPNFPENFPRTYGTFFRQRGAAGGGLAFDCLRDTFGGTVDYGVAEKGKFLVCPCGDFFFFLN